MGHEAPPLAEYYRGGLRIDVEPGARWAYSNHGFATLGQIVEDVSGIMFDRYLRERIFGPSARRAPTSSDPSGCGRASPPESTSM